MATLADFNNNDLQSTFNDPSTFAGGGVIKQGSAVNDTTITNMAAHAAVLSPSDQLLPTYSSIKNELTTDGVSPTLNTINETQTANDDASKLNTVRMGMSDPTLSPEQKAQLISGYTALQDAPVQTSLQQKVATQAAIAPSEPTKDNDETDFVRVNAVKAMDEVDAYNGWVNQQTNTIRTLGSPDGLNKTLDVVEQMVPFMNQAAQEKIRGFTKGIDPTDQGATAYNAARTLAFLGESKQDVADAVAKMPINQRMQFAQSLLNLVKAQGGSITGRPNDLAMIQELQQSLVSGEYSGTQRTLDNIQSLMDMTILGGPVWKGASKFVDAVAGISRSGLSAADTARAEAAVSRLNATTDEVISSAKPPAPEPVGPLEASTAPINPTPIDQATADATKKIITDNIHKEFTDLGVQPSTLADVKKAVGDLITPTSLQSDKLGAQITDTIQKGIKAASLDPIEDDTLANIKQFVDARTNIERRAVRTEVDPTSVSQTIKDANPAKARAMLDVASNDQTGDVAKALYGTTKDEAIGDAVAPEIAEAGGTVRNKPKIDNIGPEPDQDFINWVNKSKGMIYFDPTIEKTAMRNVAKNDWQNVMGLTPRNEMSQIGDTPTGVSFSQVYGPKDGGFSNAKQGVNQVKLSLAKYGVTEKDIEILGRDAQGNYSPVVPKGKGDYLIRVNHNYEFSPADTVAWATTSSNRFVRLFDAIPSATKGDQGGLFEHVFPGVNVNDTLLTNPGVNAADRASVYYKGLETLGKDYASKVNALPAYQKSLVRSYIIRANDKGLVFNPTSLSAIGMSDEGIDAVRAWKKVQDTNWYFENADLNQTLRARGWGRFVSSDGKTDLIVKPVGRNAVAAGDSMIDGSGKVVKMTSEQVDKLYKDGGTLAELRRPMNVDGEVITHVVSQNKASGYIRRILDHDQTLNYRDGYYAVKYNKPYYITKIVKGLDGKSYSTAIATADTRANAQALYERLRETDEAGEYNIRGDIKDSKSVEDYNWDQIVNSGRSPQRIRGKRLMDGDNTITDFAHTNIETPEQSLISSIHSLSNRMAYRNFLETAKARWMNQFGFTLKGGNDFQFPEDIRLIGKNSKLPSASAVGNAKVSWRYINSMENGYVNMLDDASKSLFNHLSDVSGTSKSWAWMEKPLRKASEGGPLAFVRKKASRLFLAANPLRQIPVQAMQALPTILSTNPLAIPKIGGQLILLEAMKRGLKAEDMAMFFDKASQLATGFTPEEANAMFEHWKLSGFEQAVSANTLIRDDLTRLVQDTPYQKATNLASMPLDIAQKYGFEFGENMLMNSVWLSEYDLLRNSGKAIDAESLENMAAHVRHLTGDMNRGGELPYQNNVLSAAMQYMQAPHKALATVLVGHKGLSEAERVRLAVANVLTFGIGGSWVAQQVDKLIPDSSPSKGFLQNGFFDIVFNKSLQTLFHSNTNIDFSDSFRLIQFPDMFQFFRQLNQSSLQQAVQASPSLGLIFGNNARINQFVQEMVRPFTDDTSRNGQQIIDDAKAFAKMFSGMSNFFKAQYVLKTHQVMGSTGKISDYNADDIEAVAALFGFRTMDEVRNQAFNDKAYQMSQKPIQDVRQLIQTTSQHLALENISTQDIQYYMRMLGQAQRVYQNNPYYMNLFDQQLAYDASKGEATIFNSVMKMIGFNSKQDIEDLVNNSNMTDDQKQSIMAAASVIESSK